MSRGLTGAALGAFLTFAGAAAQEAEGKKEEWHAPFGGRWNAYFTIASDYSYAGISNTELKPAYQVSLDWRSPYLNEDRSIWLYAGTFGSNVAFPATGPAVEVDFFGGVKARLMDRKLKLDLGYFRYLYPGTPAVLGYEYGEIGFQVDYDFGPVTVGGRLRHSRNFFGNSGQSWQKRARIGVPLDFLSLPSSVSVQAYGTLGNFWVDNFLADGLPSQDYWFWQIGFVTSAFGFDFHVAYTDTSISYEGCGSTHLCSARALFSVTKSF